MSETSFADNRGDRASAYSARLAAAKALYHYPTGYRPKPRFLGQKAAAAARGGQRNHKAAKEKSPV
jgi:hypothetical protein